MNIGMMYTEISMELSNSQGAEHLKQVRSYIIRCKTRTYIVHCRAYMHLTIWVRIKSLIKVDVVRISFLTWAILSWVYSRAVSNLHLFSVLVNHWSMKNVSRSTGLHVLYSVLCTIYVLCVFLGKIRKLWRQQYNSLHVFSFLVFRSLILLLMKDLFLAQCI